MLSKAFLHLANMQRQQKLTEVVLAAGQHEIIRSQPTSISWRLGPSSQCSQWT